MNGCAVEVWDRGIYRTAGGGCTVSVRAVVTGGRLRGGCGCFSASGVPVPGPAAAAAAAALAVKRASVGRVAGRGDGPVQMIVGRGDQYRRGVGCVIYGLIL